jgi:L-threonylcarbamoyladenylate synthase
MRVDLESPQAGIIEEAVRVIKGGGVVLYPSDTIYGLGCDPFNQRAVERLYELKQKKERKGFLVLVPNPSWVEKLTREVSSCGRRLQVDFWPGPVTILFLGNPSLPEGLLGAGGRIGLRCPASLFLRSWLRALGGPLVSTSANLSGQILAGSVADLRELFAAHVDLFLEAGDLENNEPSTVVDVTLDPPQIVRCGAASASVEAYLKAYSQNDKRC